RTYEGYRDFHMRHHKYYLSKEDPIFETYNFLGLSNTVSAPLAMLKPFLGGLAFRVVTYYHPKWFWNSSIQTKAKVILFYGVMFGVFGFYNHLDYLFIYWIVPLVFLERPLVLVNEAVEHFLVDGPARQRVGLINLFIHNDGYHFVHHA